MVRDNTPSDDEETEDASWLLEERAKWIAETDRKRSILTRDDRKYIAGEKELTGQAERSARYRINERIEGSLRDLAFLISHDQHGLLMSATQSVSDDVILRAMVARHVLEAAMTVSYASYKTGNALGTGGSAGNETPEEALEHRLENATINALNTFPEMRTIDEVDIEINMETTEFEDEDALRDKLVHEEVTEDDLKTYFARGGDIEKLRTQLEEEDEEIKIYRPTLESYVTMSPEELPDI